MALVLLTQKNLAVDFKQFILGNNVLLTAAGFMIGIATSVFIKSIADDVVIPSLYKTISYFISNKKIISKIFYNRMKFKWLNLFSESITWIFMILIAFLVINTIRNLITKIPNNNITQEQPSSK